MKLAHLILAHNEPGQLERLIKRLAHPDAHIYIHLDLKTGIAPFEHLAKTSNVFFIKDRVTVHWGSFSIVEATLSGFRQIAASGIDYGYVNLLSGQDYPLRSAVFIQQYLSEHPDIAFMNYLLFEPNWVEALPRIQEYHFNNLRIPGRYIIQSLVNKMMPKRKIPGGLTAVGRSQWFTIPLNCVAYILTYWEKHPKFRSFIKLTWGPDEFIFQTILYNSIHQRKMRDQDLRYIDWSNGGVSPKLLTMADADNIIASGELFARKFDGRKDAAILTYIDEQADA